MVHVARALLLIKHQEKHKHPASKEEMRGQEEEMRGSSLLLPHLFFLGPHLLGARRRDTVLQHGDASQMELLGHERAPLSARQLFHRFSSSKLHAGLPCHHMVSALGFSV